MLLPGAWNSRRTLAALVSLLKELKENHEKSPEDAVEEAVRLVTNEMSEDTGKVKDGDHEVKEKHVKRAMGKLLNSARESYSELDSEPGSKLGSGSYVQITSRKSTGEDDASRSNSPSGSTRADQAQSFSNIKQRVDTPKPIWPSTRSQLKMDSKVQKTAQIRTGDRPGQNELETARSEIHVQHQQRGGTDQSSRPADDAAMLQIQVDKRIAAAEMPLNARRNSDSALPNGHANSISQARSEKCDERPIDFTFGDLSKDSSNGHHRKRDSSGIKTQTSGVPPNQHITRPTERPSRPSHSDKDAQSSGTIDEKGKNESVKAAGRSNSLAVSEPLIQSETHANLQSHALKGVKNDLHYGALDTSQSTCKVVSSASSGAKRSYDEADLDASEVSMMQASRLKFTMGQKYLILLVQAQVSVLEQIRIMPWNRQCLDDINIKIVLDVFRSQSDHIVDSLHINIDRPEPVDSRLKMIDETVKTVILPLHVNGNHWALAVANLMTGEMQYFDTLEISGALGSAGMKALTRCFGKRLRNMGRCERVEWKTMIEDVPQQENGYDCGIYVLVYAVFRMARIPPPSIIDCKYFRHMFRALFVSAVPTAMSAATTVIFPLRIGEHALLQAEKLKSWLIRTSNTLEMVELRPEIVDMSKRLIKKQLDATKESLEPWRWENWQRTIELFHWGHNGCNGKRLQEMQADTEEKVKRLQRVEDWIEKEEEDVELLVSGAWHQSPATLMDKFAWDSGVFPHGQYRDDATESRQYRRYVEDDDGSLPSDGQYAEDDEVIRPGFGLNRLRAIQPTQTPPPSHNRPFNRAASCQQPRHFSPPRYYAPTPPRQAHVPHAGQQAFDPAADAYDYTESIRRGARDGSVLTDMQQSPTLPHRVPPCQQQPPACPESSRLGARDRSAIAEIQRSPNFQQQAPLFQRQSPAKRATAVESRLNSEDARAIAQIELELGEAEQRARHNPFTGEEPARESGTRSPSETASDNLRYRDSPIYPHNTDRVYEGGIIRGNSGLLRHRPRSGGRSHSRDRSHSQDRTHDRDRLHVPPEKKAS
ncbi:hypothetical protein K490DRAFT_59050 [Saccharata proteae CBS 121410]|uniref:Ubiquitin-like protease family profile domain-containing protein n=1 Tax=Saccharata proteae CBS 121410 TaxID=1314787 RepID=A0A9P4LT04_9PEZI|nr:hypothetical protein K490DRAFT_59050 [Saccharata proteae CBS 121410]